MRNKSLKENKMALSFNDQKGSAIKSAVNTFKYEDDNEFRLVGDILPRYVYWIKGENDKNIPFECLSFDRTQERFTNIEKDWVRDYYPDIKCGWAYVAQVIDPKDGKLKIINLKKKMWEQIVSTAEDLGDPTDIETGWNVHVKRKKTGPLAYNVEYQVMQLKCKVRPLSPGERLTIAELKSVEEVMPRPTAEAQKALLERIRNPSTAPANNDSDMLEDEFDVS